MNTETPKWIVVLQYLSLAWMWLFVLGISAWILHLIRLSGQLNDVPSASIGISLVAIPVFLAGAAILSYVFFGLRRGQSHSPAVPDGPEEVSDED